MPIDQRTKYKEIEAIKRKLAKQQEKADQLAHRIQHSGKQSDQRKIPKSSSLLSDKSFYLTREWRELRWKAIKASNGKCVYCGRSTISHGIVIHVDHIKPRSKFPHLALELSNLQITCEDCNLGKGTKEA